MKKEKAAISIFLIIIVISSIMLGGLFIDFTRVLVAKNRVRTATESALRSCLADYNEALVSDWGLFGVLVPASGGASSSEIQQNFEKYIKANLHTDTDEDSASILHYELVSANVSGTHNLGESEVFKKKITEYEKYRAPVSLTLGVIDKFKAIFGGGDTSGAADAAIEDFNISGARDATNQVDQAFDRLDDVGGSLIDANSIGNYAGQKNPDGHYQPVSDSQIQAVETAIRNKIQQARDALNSYKNSLSNYDTQSDSYTQMSDRIRDSVTLDGVNDGNILTEDNSITASNNNTYRNDPTDSGRTLADNAMNGEDAIMNGTNASIDAALDRLSAIENNLNEHLIPEFKQKAEAYNNEACGEGGYNSIYDDIISRGTSSPFNLSKETLDNEVISLNDPAAVDNIVNKYNDSLRINTTDREQTVTNAIRTYQENYNNIDNAIDNIINNNSKPVSEGEVSSYLHTLDNIKTYLDAMKSAIELACQIEQSSVGEISNFCGNVQSNGETLSNVNTLSTSDLNSLRIDSELDSDNSVYNKIYQMRTTLNTINSLVNSTRNLYGQFKASLNALNEYKEKSVDRFVATSPHAQLIKNLIAARARVNSAVTDYKNKVNEISHIDLYNDTQMNTIQDFVSESYDQAMGQFPSQSSGDADDSEEDDISTEDLQGKLDEIKGAIETNFSTLFNTMPSSAEQRAADAVEDGKAFDLLDKMVGYFKNLWEVIKDPKDKVYLVDYAMSNCTFLTSQTVRNHHFSKGEVEYIIFGHSSELANITSAVTEITLIRLAINAVNYWITTPGGLVSRTVTALLRGLMQTIDDMTTMLLDTGDGNSDGKIDLCPSLSGHPILTYSDHLRILMLLKMSENGGGDPLRRCIHFTLKNNYNQNIMDGNGLSSPQYLSEFQTELKGDVSVDVDLFFINLFLPEFADFGNIHDGKFTVKSSVEYGY